MGRAARAWKFLSDIQTVQWLLDLFGWRQAVVLSLLTFVTTSIGIARGLSWLELVFVTVVMALAILALTLIITNEFRRRAAQHSPQSTIEGQAASGRPVPASAPKPGLTVKPSPLGPFPHPFLGPRVLSLIAELRRLSGKTFRSECVDLLDEDEILGREERMSLEELVHSKTRVVESLGELVRTFRNVEQWMLSDSPTTVSYEFVAEKYRSLLSQRWVLAAPRYKDGPDPVSGFQGCAYGLVEIDQTQLRDLKAILDATETAIRTATIDYVAEFRSDHLFADLVSSGLPINGGSLTQGRLPDTDSVDPIVYLPLSDGRCFRASLKTGAALSDSQLEDARRIVREHEQTMEKHRPIFETLRNRLVREGLKVSTIRFTRTASELGFHPEKFVPVDSELGILEIRSLKPFTQEQRTLIKTIAVEVLARRKSL